jgi:hypothetical protein
MASRLISPSDVHRAANSGTDAGALQRIAHRLRGALSSPALLVLGALWLLDGALQLQSPMFTRSLLNDVINPAAQGQPWFVAGPMGWTLRLLAQHVAQWNALFAAVQLAIGFGMLWRRTAKVAILMSFAWALGVWWLGEGLGGIASGQASVLTGGPGAVLLYAVVGMVVWPRDGHPTSDGGLLGPLGARAAWAVLWVGAGVTQMVAGGLASTLSGAAGGEPHIFSALDRSIARVAAGHGTLAAAILGSVEIAVGLGALWPRTLRTALAVGAVVSLFAWAAVQDFGALFSGMSTDPNAGPLFILMAACLYPLGNRSFGHEHDRLASSLDGPPRPGTDRPGRA